MRYNQVSFEELMAEFTRYNDQKSKVELRIRVLEPIKANSAHGVILFRNVDMCSSHLGESVCVVFGPECRIKDAKALDGSKFIGDLPSVRQYAQCWAYSPGFKPDNGAADNGSDS